MHASLAEHLSPTAEVLAEIAGLCERSLGARRHTRRFLDTAPCIGSFEIDRVATAAAGEDVFIDKPTDGLLGLLATLRALETEIYHVGDSAGRDCG